LAAVTALSMMVLVHWADFDGIGFRECVRVFINMLWDGLGCSAFTERLDEVVEVISANTGVLCFKLLYYLKVGQLGWSLLMLGNAALSLLMFIQDSEFVIEFYQHASLT
jgi:hypothetical protein